MIEGIPLILGGEGDSYVTGKAALFAERGIVGTARPVIGAYHTVEEMEGG